MIIQKIFPFPKIIILLQTQIYQKLEIIEYRGIDSNRKEKSKETMFLAIRYRFWETYVSSESWNRARERIVTGE